MINPPIFLGSKAKVSSNLNENQNRIFNVNNTGLIIIDVQEKLIGVIPNKEDLIFNISKVIEACDHLNIVKYFTEQNPEKLGKTVKEIIQGNEANKFSKMSFSCAECNDLINELKSQNIKNLYLVGIETHICILQSAFDLYSIGFNVQIIADSVNSRKNFDHVTAIKRMSESGIQVSSTETAIFELCKTASHPKFRELSRIVKRTNN